jgi:hypothetical protein
MPSRVTPAYYELLSLAHLLQPGESALEVSYARTKLDHLSRAALQRLDGEQIDAGDVGGRDGRVALAQPERGVEVLRRGSEVADRGRLRLVTPLQI